ncbi:hypothetical protein PENANT_c008G08908 [Penicillium antarcticum]|uniref:Protein kinase domain-containing protein n=1 Tax=Penicillium antarcticum TaxID=416450 RepID=A0A1V6QAE8_9EURO|nr:hypothetical protein PENANT_c008G08908 [Penicillium antarcticum]
MEEINVLRKFRGIPNIAQLAGLVISENPYKPNPCTKRPTVVTGFLVEYYPGGILQQTSENRDEVDADLPMRWTVQIGRALEPMHENGHAHLDMKRENVVLDAENRAIVIDTGRIGGCTEEQLSPEAYALLESHEISPFDMSFGGARCYGLLGLWTGAVGSC